MKNQVITANLILRYPQNEDFASLKAFNDRNKDHLSTWESLSNLSDAELKKSLHNWKIECDEGKSVRFFIVLKEKPDQIIGMCNFTQIFLGSFKACYLGYKIDLEYEGKGLMLESLRGAIHYVFEELGLHRIMANYMPNNVKSARLLERLGFMIEGYAKNYLLINNRWEDHVLTALTFEQWKNLQSADRPSNVRHDPLKFRNASLRDLKEIVALLFEDDLGQKRESLSHPLSNSYIEAFSKICSDPNSELIIAELHSKVIGVLQITYLRHLTFQGSRVAHIEGVRIHKDYQKMGFGKQLFQWVVERAKSQGCNRVQLMTDKIRTEAHQFYKQIGFAATHEGMKLFI